MFNLNEHTLPRLSTLWRPFNIFLPSIDQSERQHYSAPEDWLFEGWTLNDEPINPLRDLTHEERLELSSTGQICGAFSVTGYIGGLHSTDPAEAGGAYLNVLFHASPPPPDYFCRFQKTREGGLNGQHNAGSYSRFFHLLPDPVPDGADEWEKGEIAHKNKLLPELLECARRAGRRGKIEMRGLIYWVEYYDQARQEEWSFWGFDRKIACPTAGLSGFDRVRE